MPIAQEFIDVVASENLKICASYPAQRLQTNTIDFDRMRQQMADNAVERQNGQNRDYHLLSSRMMKDVVEPDIESANAYKEIATGVSPTSQGYHFANTMQEVNSATTVSIQQLGSTLSGMNTMLAQLVGLLTTTK